MIERIEHVGNILAIIIPADHHDDGIHFYTPGDYSQQLAYMNRPGGYRIEPHLHRLQSREVRHTQEVLFIRKGKVKVDFYDESRTFLESRIVSTGDVIMLASGGHGFEMMEPSEIIEVKQGPYLSDDDKVRFSP